MHRLTEAARSPLASALGATWISFGVAVAAISGFLFSIVTAHSMDPQERGSLVQIMSVVGLASFLATGGLPNPMTAVARGSLGTINLLIEKMLPVLAALAAPVALMAGAVAWALTPDADRVPWVAALATGTVLLSAATTVMLIRSRVATKYWEIGASQAVAAVVPLALVFLMSRDSRGGLVTALAGMMLGNALIVSILGVSQVDQRGERGLSINVQLGQSESRRGLSRLGVLDVFSGLPALAIDRLDVVLVGAFMSTSAASHYAVSKSLASPLVLISAIVPMYFGPKFAALPNGARLASYRSAMRLVAGAAIGLALLGAVLAVVLLAELYGATYAGSLGPGILLIAGGSLTTLSMVPGAQLRVLLDYGFLNLVSYLALGAFLCLGAAFLAAWGLVGLASAYSLVAAPRFAAMNWRARRLLRGAYEADLIR